MRNFSGLLLAIIISGSFSACTTSPQTEPGAATAEADDQPLPEIVRRQPPQNAARIRSIVERIYATSERSEKERLLLEFRNLYHPLIEAGSVQPYRLLFFSSDGAPVFPTLRGMDTQGVHPMPLSEMDTRSVHAMLVMDPNTPILFQPFLICDIDPRFVETYLSTPAGSSASPWQEPRRP